MLRATLKGLLAHRVRLVLTACAIALGVGFMAGTFILTATISHGIDNLFASASAGTDVIVRPVAASNGGGGAGGPGDSQALARPAVPASLVSQVRQVAGVAAADGATSDRAGIAGGDGKLLGGRAGLAIGYPPDAALAAAYPVRQGRAPAGPTQVAVDAATAAQQGYHVGDRIRVVAGGRARPFTISGIIGFGQADGPGVVSMVAFDPATAQRLYDRHGTYDEIDLKAAAGVTPGTLRGRVAGVLPSGYEAVTAASAAATQASDLRGQISFLTNGLLAFALISLFVGAFIIWNTFSILVAQRTRELALLRALGASRRQVLRSVLVEAAVLGLVASLAGLGLGVLAAAGLQALLRGASIDLPSTGLDLPAGSAALAVGTGVLITLLVAFAPARKATVIAPIAALRTTAPAVRTFSARRLASGAAVTAAGMLALLVGLFGRTGAGSVLVGGGALAAFIGVTVLSPLFAKQLAGAIGAPLRRLPGRTGVLACDNAMRNPSRTAATAAALMVGLALVAASAVLDASLKHAADQAIDQGTLADLYVQPADPDSGLDPALARTIAAQPGVAAAGEVRETEGAIAGTSFQKVDGVDPATIGQVADLKVRAGSVAALDDAIGNVLVATGAARSHHWTVGSTVPVELDKSKGAGTLRVAGTFAGKGSFGDFLISLASYDQITGQPTDTLVMVKAAPGTGVGALKTRINGMLGAYPGAKVLDQAGFKQATAATLDQILNLLVALLALAVIIALLGIVNTLALSVVERTRELGLLRAIGMRRAQVGAMVAGEAMIIAVFGAILGIVLGVGLGSALAAALTRGNGATVVAIPGAQLLVYGIGAGIAGILAAIAPARRAAKLNVLTAIASE
jgi:putative ABC transport system permease protein